MVQIKPSYVNQFMSTRSPLTLPLGCLLKPRLFGFFLAVLGFGSPLPVLAQDTIPPSAPEGVSAVELDETSALVSWTAATDNIGVAGYEVFRDGALLGTVTTTNFTDSGALDKYRSYEYTVRAYDGATNYSPLSSAAIFAYRRFPFVLAWDDANSGITDLSGWSGRCADRFVTTTNGHLYAGSERIRFLGINMVFAAAFPAHADAEKLAARFAKLGVNCVRFHHMDTQSSPSGIFRNLPSSDPMYKRALDAGQLDKLDYFIAQLKQHGIYANLNLHVGRNYPGFPTNGVSDYFKGLDNYMPGMIDLQKEYARDLLTHLDPYTGQSYVNEPAVALIEINNENGLIYQWHNGLFGPNLHSNYITELTSQWNGWLGAKYANTEAVRGAWAPAAAQPYGNELLSNGNFASGFVPPWILEVTSPAAATQRVITNGGPGGIPSLEISVQNVGGSNWNVQCYQTNISFLSNVSYTVSFWAKAETPRAASVLFQQQNAPWQELGSGQFALGTNWQLHTFVIPAMASEARARLNFGGFAGQTGKVWFASVSLKPGNLLLGPWSACAEGSSGAEMVTNGSFSAGFASPWSFQVTAPAVATRQVLTNSAPNGSNALEIVVSTTSTSSWHVQFFQTGLRVTNGQPYTISFSAKTELPRSLSTGFQQQNSPWGGLGSLNVNLATNWEDYQVVVTATATENYTRLNMSGLGNQTGAVWFANISVRGGMPGLGLAEGETLGGISIIAKNQFALRSRAAQRDWMRFLWETERAYWTGMRNYIKQELGGAALVLGTQTSYSPALLQAELDVVDTHAYWQHPSFPNKPWDGNDWYVRNQSMAGLSSGGTLPGRANTRIAGKPFLCTEYNHPAPLTYCTETLPLLAAYAALQDWDGIFGYDYMGSTNWDRGYFSSWFDIGREPAKLVTFPIAAALFRRADAAPAAQQVTVVVPLDVAIDRTGQTDAQLGLSDFGVDSLLGMQNQMNIATGTLAHSCSTWRDTGAAVYASDTGQLFWDTAQKLVTIRTPRLKAIIGQTRQQTFDLGDGVSIAPGPSMQSNDWASIALLLKDGDSFQTLESRMLLIATGYSDNHGLRWRDGMGPTDPTSSIYATNWGKKPSLLEGIAATISLAQPAARVRVWALDESGQPKMPVPVFDSGGRAAFVIDLQYQTPWYQVSSASNEPPSIVLSPTNRLTLSFSEDLVLTANALDVDGNLAAVDFYAGSMFLGSATNPPFTLRLPGIYPGSYRITAVARDAAGLATTSSVASVTVSNTSLRLVNAGSDWNYFDRMTDLGTAWRWPAYDDSNWSNGLARLGYGADGEVTQVASNRLRITTYFRRAFTVPANVAFSNLTVRLQRDDGAVIYLNGQELLRSNMTNGPIAWGTFATNVVSGGDETRWFTNTASAINLVAGTNLLAAEIHQSNTNSSDLGFDMELTGLPVARAPALSVSRDAAWIILAWPIGALGYTLESTTDLASPALWEPVSGLASPSNENWLLGIPIDPAPARFYRLATP